MKEYLLIQDNSGSAQDLHNLENELNEQAKKGFVVHTMVLNEQTKWLKFLLERDVPTSIVVRPAENNERELDSAL